MPSRQSLGQKNSNQLIVEGPDDLFAVVGLMRAHTPWPENRNQAPVWIEISNGIENILSRAYLSTKFKTPGLECLGVIIDADNNWEGRYTGIRNLVLGLFPEMPTNQPEAGLIVDNGDHRFGVWIMPDNISAGMLETFLKNLVPDTSHPLWEHAKQSVVTAKEIGANCRDVHLEKANIHTWLAWHEPPGQTLGVALTKKILDPSSPHADAFVKWFKDLYALP